MIMSCLRLLSVAICTLATTASYGDEISNAESLFSLVIKAMHSEDGLLPKFKKTTIAGMRQELFGEAERRDPNFATTWYQPEGSSSSWSSTAGLHTNFDYLRFIKLQPDLEVSFTSRAACPNEPYLETTRFTVPLYKDITVVHGLVEAFAYYYYLEQALSVALSEKSPLSTIQRKEMLRKADSILELDWQQLSYEETQMVLDKFWEHLYTDILDFNENEIAFELAEIGAAATFIYDESWECGGYESAFYYIERSENNNIMIISDLDYEICKALNLDPWSSTECLAWQPFPEEEFLASGWYRVKSVELGVINKKGSIRPQSAIINERDFDNPLRISVESAFQ